MPDGRVNVVTGLMSGIRTQAPLAVPPVLPPLGHLDRGLLARFQQADELGHGPAVPCEANRRGCGLPVGRAREGDVRSAEVVVEHLGRDRAGQVVGLLAEPVCLAGEARHGYAHGQVVALHVRGIDAFEFRVALDDQGRALVLRDGLGFLTRHAVFPDLPVCDPTVERVPRGLRVEHGCVRRELEGAWDPPPQVL